MLLGYPGVIGVKCRKRFRHPDFSWKRMIFDKTLLLMEGSIRRMVLYVNHEYYTPQQVVEIANARKMLSVVPMAKEGIYYDGNW
jgi:hypothetical protein